MTDLLAEASQWWTPPPPADLETMPEPLRRMYERDQREIRKITHPGELDVEYERWLRRGVPPPLTPPA